MVETPKRTVLIPDFLPAARSSSLGSVVSLASARLRSASDSVPIWRDREAEKAGATETHTSDTILSNIRVLAIDQTLGEKDGQRVVIGKTTTLELTPRQAETLALSRQLGTLSLALRSLADAGETTLPNDDERATGRRAGINTVRFGISTMSTPK